jgi:molybdenum cofactor cytidylyltransferase
LPSVSCHSLFRKGATVEAKLAAILLAAGNSSRMGTLKQLLPVHDRPAVVCCVENIANSGIDNIVVVVNADSKEIVRALQEFPVVIAVNDLPESEMADSVAVGLGAVPEDSTGVFVCLADHPLVVSSTLSAMAGQHAAQPGFIIIPTFEGRRGHPALFPRSFLEQVNARGSLRDIIDSHRDRLSVFAVNDEGVVLDMDTPEDYQKILHKC